MSVKFKFSKEAEILSSQNNQKDEEIEKKLDQIFGVSTNKIKKVPIRGNMKSFTHKVKKFVIKSSFRTPQPKVIQMKRVNF